MKSGAAAEVKRASAISTDRINHLFHQFIGKKKDSALQAVVAVKTAGIIFVVRERNIKVARG